MSKPEVIFWMGDSRGVYLPRDFATCFVNRDKNVEGVSAEEWATLEAGPSPDNEHYDETWCDVLDKAIVISEGGVRYRLQQDGDLWLVPVGMEWSDELDAWAWPVEEESET